MKFLFTILAATILGVTQVQCQEPFIQEGTASYYGHEFHGRRTSSGEKYSKHKLTAAHPSLAFGTLVRVTNRDNGNSVVVKINDRGPSTKKRVIDVSYAAAIKLGMIAEGTANVRIESIEASSTEAEDSVEEAPKNQASKEMFQLDVKMAPNEGWAIQIGSYSEAANFIRLADQIKQTYNKPLLVEVATAGEKRVYRLLIGPEKNQESAKAMLLLVKKEYPDAFVIML